MRDGRIKKMRDGTYTAAGIKGKAMCKSRFYSDNDTRMSYSPGAVLKNLHPITQKTAQSIFLSWHRKVMLCAYVARYGPRIITSTMLHTW